MTSTIVSLALVITLAFGLAPETKPATRKADPAAQAWDKAEHAQAYNAYTCVTARGYAVTTYRVHPVHRQKTYALHSTFPRHWTKAQADGWMRRQGWTPVPRRTP